MGVDYDTVVGVSESVFEAAVVFFKFADAVLELGDLLALLH